MLYAIFFALLLIVSAFALWKGETSERVGGGALALALLVTANVQRDMTGAAPYIVAGVDLLLLAVFLSLAFKTSRTWPIWAAAFHLLNMTSHVVFFLKLSPPDSYSLAQALAGFGVVGSLAVGTFWVWQEREALKPLE